MKTINSQHKPLSTVLSLLTLCSALAVPRSALSQLPAIYFTNLDMAGNAADTTINIKARNNPVSWRGTAYRLPLNGTNITTTNGVGVIHLVPGDYIAAYAGIPQSWSIHVTNSATDLNALDLTTDLTRYSGVETLTGTGGIVITPPTGPGGNWTVDGSGVAGGNGNGNGHATNVYQTQISGAGLTLTTNLSTFVYTLALNPSLQGFSAITLTALTNSLNAFALQAATASTNGYPWGVLYDATGTAQTATNGMGLASGLAGFRGTNTFDAAGAGVTAATAATNAIGLSGGLAAFRGTNTFASTNAATASTLGLMKPDNVTTTIAADGTISAVNGGNGNVLGAAFSTDATFALWSGTGGKVITNRDVTGTWGPASFDLLGYGTNAASAATNALATALAANFNINTQTVTRLYLPFSNSVARVGSDGILTQAVSGVDYDAPGAAAAATNNNLGIGWVRFPTNTLSTNAGFAVLTGGDLGSQFGILATGTNSGAGFGYHAYGNDNGAAFGQLSDGGFDGAAFGNAANGNNHGFAGGEAAKASGAGTGVGAETDGSNLGTAVGNGAHGPGEGNIAIGSGGNVQAMVTNSGWTFTTEIGAGTAELEGALNYHGHAVVDTNGVHIGSGSGLTSTINGSVLTGTNITLTWNTTTNLFDVTNDGPHIFITIPNGGFGTVAYRIKPLSGGHVTLHIFPDIQFYSIATNNVATNATLAIDGWGSTNAGFTIGSIREVK
jgi:hypothetical protein